MEIPELAALQFQNTPSKATIVSIEYFLPSCGELRFGQEDRAVTQQDIQTADRSGIEPIHRGAPLLFVNPLDRQHFVQKTEIRILETLIARAGVSVGSVMRKKRVTFFDEIGPIQYARRRAQDMHGLQQADPRG